MQRCEDSPLQQGEVHASSQGKVSAQLDEMRAEKRNNISQRTRMQML